MIRYYLAFLFELEVPFSKNNYIDIFSALVIFKAIAMIKKVYFTQFQETSIDEYSDYNTLFKFYQYFSSGKGYAFTCVIRVFI